jgi:hypothetical protein
VSHDGSSRFVSWPVEDYKGPISASLFLNAVYLRTVSCRRTAIPNDFFVPTTTTSFFPLATADSLAHLMPVILPALS